MPQSSIHQLSFLTRLSHSECDRKSTKLRTITRRGFGLWVMFLCRNQQDGDTLSKRRFSENSLMRTVLSLAVAVALTGIFAPSSADAGLFDCFKKRSACCPDPCAAPAPSCCAPVAPTCCAPEPCCAPDPCAKKCRLPRLGLFKKMFNKHRSPCCPEPCCEPAPSCCAPAAPSCCAPAMPAPACGCGH